MTESITIPAHIENGSIRLDAPLPADIERVDVVVHRRSAPQSKPGVDLISFLDSLPLGKHSKAELDARLETERNSWPD